MYSQKYANNTNSIYEHTCRVVRPCFHLQPGDEITVVTGIEPRIGDLVLVQLDGKRRIGLVRKSGVEFTDETITAFATLIGVVT